MRGVIDNASLGWNSIDARATRVLVSRQRVRGRLCLSVRDDGDGVIPEMGREEALRVLTDFAFDPMRREIIWSAASAALVADAAVDSNERQVAREIAGRLGIATKRP